LINETTYFASAWLKFEGGGWTSREDVTLLAGSGAARNLKSGTVLGKVTASGKLVPLAPAAGDGSQNAYGILLFDNIVPNGVDKRAAIISGGYAVVSDNGIIWPSGITGNQIATATAQLLAKNVIVREGA
jgi:hypothetical protein